MDKLDAYKTHAVAKAHDVNRGNEQRSIQTEKSEGDFIKSV